MFYDILPLKPDVLNSFKNNNAYNILEYAKSYPNEKIKRIANGLIDLMKHKHEYSKNECFEIIQELLYGNDVKTKQSENLKLLKDLIISSELLDECEIFNEVVIEENNLEKGQGVQLMTIHKSKGLEFKYVFIISVNEGIIPAQLKDDESIAEERRLFYVAITRAREFLHISSAETHYLNGLKKNLRQSVFMLEL